MYRDFPGIGNIPHSGKCLSQQQYNDEKRFVRLLSLKDKFKFNHFGTHMSMNIEKECLWLFCFNWEAAVDKKLESIMKMGVLPDILTGQILTEVIPMANVLSW